jgi:dTDP-4-dehydrorhamnose 3,5-epimerase
MIQGNRSNKQRGAVVGLHYHLHQADYWYCPVGTIRVVLHDLREGGPTDGATECFDISGENHLGVFIPPGVAHGFAALTDVVMTYLVDGYYNPADELGVKWDDPVIGADWGVTDPILSAARPGQPVARRPARRPQALLADAHLSARSLPPEAPHEAVRHRRRRVHRLELRPPHAGQHRRRGHRLDALTYAGNLETSAT